MTTAHNPRRPEREPKNDNSPHSAAEKPEYGDGERPLFDIWFETLPFDEEFLDILEANRKAADMPPPKSDE